MIALDAASGASGDMLLGALVDLGADAELLDRVEDVVPVEIDVGRVDRAGVSATTVDVAGGGDDGDDDHHHRAYTEVRGIVEDADLPAAVTADALAVFERLGAAEAAVHDVPLDELAFHEVGADDAIADVVGACLLLRDLGARPAGSSEEGESVSCTPIRVGGGTVESAHGDMPVPVPAVTEILEGTGHRIEGGPVEAELLTPTGAALLAYWAEPVAELPEMALDATGHGAGDADVDRHPNVLRALRGDAAMDREAVVVLETNVDDVAPEVLGSLYDTLLEAGARDVTIQPLGMKKNRPGHLVSVVTRRPDADRLARLLAEETGTLGVRATERAHRFVADRELEDVTVTVGGEEYEARVKLASVGGDVYDVSAEFDDARRIAADAGVPVRRVLEAVEREYEG